MHKRLSFDLRFFYMRNCVLWLFQEARFAILHISEFQNLARSRFGILAGPSLSPRVAEARPSEDDRAEGREGREVT